jgi:hypothetical protein
VSGTVPLPPRGRNGGIFVALSPEEKAASPTLLCAEVFFSLLSVADETGRAADPPLRLAGLRYLFLL